MTVAEAPGEVIVTANVDMRALRAARLTEWSMLNWGPLINAVYAPVYLNRTVWPHDVKPLDAEGVKKLKQEVVESLAQRQMITKP